MANVYDDPAFFEGYMKIRNAPTSYNELLEQPALRALLPDLAGCRVLELGCGAGHGARSYRQLGAKAVTGIDSSEKMLALARETTRDDAIIYRQMDMADAGSLDGPFDHCVSSMAMHYPDDAGFTKTLQGVHTVLRPSGCFVFSQEHPVVTAPLNEPSYGRDEQGRAMYYKLSDYGRPGRRATEWLVPGAKNFVVYHRSLAAIVNALLAAGFLLDEISEPLPGDEALAKNPELYKEFHKPNFLLVRCHKPA